MVFVSIYTKDYTECMCSCCIMWCMCTCVCVRCEMCMHIAYLHICKYMVVAFLEVLKKCMLCKISSASLREQSKAAQIKPGKQLCKADVRHCDSCICLGKGVVLLRGVDLLKSVCHCGFCLKTLILAAWKSVFHWQPSDEDVELSAPPVPCLSGCFHSPALMIMDWTSEPINQPQLNVVLVRLALVMVSVSQK